MGDEEELSKEELVEAGKALAELAQAERMQREDLLYTLGFEPEKAADGIWEIFNSVMWQNDPPEHDVKAREQEHTPEELAERQKEWDAEMAKFWKSMDNLVGAIMGHPDRPEFNPG
ncbi:MAG: hypothetical protein JSR24_23480 [Proteobacteria bacterium]|nr:hypothetical protein [Pseudomonadota bacterium]